METLQEKLASLKAGLAQSQTAKFGMSFPPPIPEEQVVAFEREHGVRLPEALRAIITQVSDGLGLWPPLAEWEVATEALRSPFRAEEIGGFSMPTLGEYIEEHVESDEEDEEVDHDSLYSPWIDETLSDYDAWRRELDAATSRGTLRLQKFDGEKEYFLVVSGADAGDVWEIEQRQYQDETCEVAVNRLGSIFDFIEQAEI